MKTLFATVALVAMIAAPALAQTSPRQTRDQSVSQTRHAAKPTAALVVGVRHSDNPAFDVYTPSGRYLGSDPDSRVRFELLRDAGRNHD